MNYTCNVEPVRLGQVRSECLTCTFRASCCSARLSRAQVPGFAGSSVRDRCVKRNHSRAVEIAQAFFLVAGLRCMGKYLTQISLLVKQNSK